MKKSLLTILLILFLLLPLTIQVSAEVEFDTVDEWLTYAESHNKASKILDAYQNAYQQYPENEQIIAGLQDGASQLLDWATIQHVNGNIETARNRYEFILNTPELNENIQTEVNKKLEYAENDQVIPTVTDIQNQADQLHKASEILNVYKKGHQLYPDNQMIGSRLNDSAESLYRWAKTKHKAGEFTTAETRYQRILDVPTLNQELRGEVSKHLEYASKQQKSPNQLLELAQSSNYASEIVDLYHKGYQLYSEDTRFQDGLRNAAENLLDWSTRKHIDGNIEIAKQRYEKINALPVLTDVLKKELRLKLDYANDNRSLPTASDIIKKAKNLSKASDIVNTYQEGYQLYPDNTDIVNGLQEGVHSLLSWAEGQHKLKHYNTAVDRYEKIINTPALENDVKQKVENNLAYAKNEQISPNQLLEMADDTNKASKMLEIYSEGYELYPEEDQFEKGVQDAARALLNWATYQHQEGRIKTAETRYQRIINSPVSDDMIHKVEQRLAYAEQGDMLPSVAEFYDKAEQTNKASEQLQIFTNGYDLYPNNSDLKDALKDSVINLLDWATIKHQKGKIETAALRYERIKGNPVLNQTLKTELTRKIDLAEEGKSLQTENELINQAAKASKASEQLDILVNAYQLYPRNEELAQKLEQSVINLLDWATRKHRNGSVDTAKIRYQRILDTPNLNKQIKDEVDKKLAYANNSQPLPEIRTILDNIKQSDRASEMLSIAIDGYDLYPRNRQIENALNESAQNLLNWAMSQHQDGDFSTAIDRYETIIQTEGVNYGIISRAKESLALAENKERIHLVNDIVNGNVANYSYKQMRSDIQKLEQSYGDLIETRIIGNSVDDRNLYAVKLGNGDQEIFFNAAHHAREHMTTNVLMEMIDEYAQAYNLNDRYNGYDVRDILNEVSIWFVPMVNPDGVMLVQEGASSADDPSEVISINNGSRDFDRWKANVRGVDLNRQYPYLWKTVANNPGYPNYMNYKGRAPLTEPETKAIYDFTNNHNFLAAIAYHSSGELIYTRYGFDSHSRNVAEGVERITGYQPIDLQSSTSGAGYTDWFVKEKNLPGITPEISPYVGERPVPLSNWNSIWNENKTVGLYIADYIRDNF
ncbi:mannosyl-glycoprotein endo-beta-N-acetylglucosaminidase [Gracilibacillus halophilus YIM-C55.5]|uniref:Mannosyl-glycoprotein endo-beta-N-acetylglucosaminidase n=1 Tax=Gracilibacillus halophilus YIM-C55.5 TaxID=1308866 RepID=N4WYH8_9BACI|nr:M14 family metallocarboxypeptidase [Gracilibacillus halophilus]ENH98081.1 mannosyl-glycoprotein endo-beta-N-acetylglucosaminidase [Gracilibacillus halophilus YIM-C55.5]